MMESIHRADVYSALLRWFRVLLLGSIAAAVVGCGKSPEQRIDAARTAMAGNDYPTAVVELKNALRGDPESSEARAILAEVSLGLGDVATAEKELERAYELGLDAAAYRALHYRIQISLGNFEEVSVSLEQPGGADGLSPAEAATFKGDALLGLRRAEEGEESYRRALMADGNYGDAKIGLARALVIQDRRREAMAILDDAVVAHPEIADGWTMRGQISLRAGRHEQARDDLEKAVEVAQATPDRLQEYFALASLAEAYLGLNDITSAKQTVTAMMQIAGDSPMTRNVLARVYIAEEKYTEARAELQRVVNANDADAAALFLLGATYLAENDPVQAQIHLERVVRLAPDNLAARRLLAEAQLQQSRPDSAVETLAPLLESERAMYPKASTELGQVLMRSGETEEAIKLLERSHAAEPDDMEVAMSLGVAYLKSGRTEDAIKLFESLPESDDIRRELLLAVAYAAKNESEQSQARIDQIIAKKPDDVSALLVVTQFYFATGQLGEARQYAEQVLEKDRGNIPARELLARIELIEGNVEAGLAELERLLADAPNNLFALMALGESAIRENRLDDANRLLEHAVDVGNRNPGPNILLARARLVAGDNTGAEEAAGEAFERAPENPLVLLVMGEVSYAAGRYREALGYVSDAAERQPNNPATWQMQARAQLALQDRAAARESLNRALEIDPTMLTAAAQLTLLDSAEGNTDAALARVNGLKAAYPSLAAPDVLEGEVLLRAEDFAAAAMAFERAYDKAPSSGLVIRVHQANLLAGGDAVPMLKSWLSEHPDDDRVRIILAEYREQSGDSATAIDEYERALEANANNAFALNNLAWLLNEKDDPRAEDFARRALTLRPDMPAIKDTLGWVLVNKGEYEEAVEVLEAAHEAAPEEGEIAYHLAVALQKSGERDRSGELLRELLAADRPFESRADAERLLSELGGP